MKLLNKNSLPRTNSAGFTLMELVIYLGIVSFVTVLLAASMSNLLGGRGKTQSQQRVSESIQFLSDRITDDIRQATSISVPATSGAQGSTLTMLVANASVTYTLTGTTVTRQSGVASAEAITPSDVAVTALNFQRLENTNTPLSYTSVSIITNVTMTNSTSDGSSAYSKSKTFSASLR